MFNKLFICCALTTMLFTACEKAESTVTSGDAVPTVSLTNANGSAKTVDFFLNGEKKNVTAAVAANGTILGTYIAVPEGNASLSVKDVATGNAELYSGVLTVVKNKSYNFFVYDTLITGKLKGILLESDRKIDENNTSTAKVRFLNLSAKSPSMDLWMVRRQGGIPLDSVNIGAKLYLGSVGTPDAAALSTYTTVPASEVAGSTATGAASTDYIFRLKLTGTNTVVSSSAATLVIPARNYTVFARGTYPASAVTILLNN